MPASPVVKGQPVTFGASAVRVTDRPVPARSPERLVEWTTVGGGPTNARYSALTEINRNNVNQLAVAWRWRPEERPLTEYGTVPGNFTATPIMIDNVVYVSTNYNRVAALDADTGKMKRYWGAYGNKPDDANLGPQPPQTIVDRRIVEIAERQVVTDPATGATKTADVKRDAPANVAYEIDPAKCAVVVCDMWDDHWCKSAAARCGERSDATASATATRRTVSPPRTVRRRSSGPRRPPRGAVASCTPRTARG